MFLFLLGLMVLSPIIFNYTKMRGIKLHFRVNFLNSLNGPVIHIQSTFSALHQLLYLVTHLHKPSLRWTANSGTKGSTVQNKTITSGGETIEGDKPLDRDKKRKWPHRARLLFPADECSGP